MTTDLEAFRDHCRTMQDAVHTPECHRLVERPGGLFGPRTERVSPDPECQGCVTDQDRALFNLLATEVDAYLAPPADQGLWDNE